MWQMLRVVSDWAAGCSWQLPAMRIDEHQKPSMHMLVVRFLLLQTLDAMLRILEVSAA
jgi:hypothetical protein